MKHYGTVNLPGKVPGIPDKEIGTIWTLKNGHFVFQWLKDQNMFYLRSTVQEIQKIINSVWSSPTKRKKVE